MNLQPYLIFARQLAYRAGRITLSHYNKGIQHDLKKRGIPPGPKYTEILRCLRAAWLDGEVKSEEEEKTLLNNLLEKA